MSHDVIHRFSFTSAPIRGQWVRLTDTVAELEARRSYPEPIRVLVSQMLAAVALMADGIKFTGAVALQSRGSGPVTTALAECREQHLLRGLARWDEDHAGLRAAEVDPALQNLLGDGQMAISLIPDRDKSPDATPYQGVVSISEGPLAENLEAYFANSEQLPTRLFFAETENSVTGLLVQRLPVSDAATEVELDQHEALWNEVELLTATLRPDELATLPVVDLLRRLYHEHLVTLHPGRALEFSCTCSRERAERMLQALPKAEILELLETEGMVDVTCEVCGARYEYDQVDAHVLYDPEARRYH